jgi:hypothetical protein
MRNDAKAQAVAALWSKTKHYDWTTTDFETQGNMTIVFHDKRAHRTFLKALDIILKRKQVIHKGRKP